MATTYNLLVLLSALVFAVAASHAAAPEARVYWNRVLPNTPIPGAIRDLLNPETDLSDEKSGTAVNVGKGGVAVNTGRPKPGGTSVNVGHGSVNVNTGKPKPGGTGVNVGKGGVNVNTGKGRPGGGTSVNVGHGGVVVNTPRRKNPFIYRYAAAESQARDDPNTALFFLEKDLKSGNKMTLHFAPTTSGASFISPQEANSVPFASNKFDDILQRLSVEPESEEAAAMEQTLSECEEPAADGERKFCATSLVSMVEFSMAGIGSRDIQAVSTEVEKEDSPKQLYTILGAKKLPGSDLVVCHAERYAYAVFYCHTAKATEAYRVPMVGKDGTKVEAVAVCHVDTAAWNPKHIAFRVLNVKPGTVPICHFLPQDHLVWSSKM